MQEYTTDGQFLQNILPRIYRVKTINALFVNIALQALKIL